MGLEDPPSDVWLHSRLVIGPSRIHGQGLFAVDDIANGTILMKLAGHLVSSAELAHLIARARSQPEQYVDTITVYEDAHLVIPARTKIHFGNHSCDPNAWHVGPYDIAARRDVRAGEEVTIDYATSSGEQGFSMMCNCGSSLCRHEITSEDWRRPELQQRYGDHWVPALQGRIARSQG